MTSLYYHPVYAWNLIEDLGRSGVITEQTLRGYPERRLSIGRQEGWINEANRRTARQMFVYADSVVLPPRVDLPVNALPGKEREHLEWGRSFLAPDEYAMLRPEYDTDVGDGWDGALIAAMQHRAKFSPAQIRELLDWWQRMRAFEEDSRRGMGEQGWQNYDHSGIRQALVDDNPEACLFWKHLGDKERAHLREVSAKDPLREDRTFAAIQSDIGELHSVLKRGLRLAAKGVPTFAFCAEPSVNRLLRESLPGDAGDAEAYAALVQLYFDSICLPAPSDAKEAIAWRGSDRVADWRAKIQAWEEGLRTDKLDLKTMQYQLDDANAYLRGATVISSTLGRISPWVTFGLSMVEQLFSLPFSDAITVGLMALEGGKLVGRAIEGRVFGRNPPQYGWVMVGYSPSPPIE